MKPSNFGHMISRGKEAYPVSLKQSRLVKMIVVVLLRPAKLGAMLPSVWTKISRSKLSLQHYEKIKLIFQVVQGWYNRMMRESSLV